jgi:hypothetical protein
MVYLPEDKLQELKDWAKEVNRPVSNLAATIILSALEERGDSDPPTSSTSGDGKKRKKGGEE